MSIPDRRYSHASSKPDGWDKYQGCGLTWSIVRGTPGASAFAAHRAALSRRRRVIGCALVLVIAAVASVALVYGTAAGVSALVVGAAAAAWALTYGSDTDRWLRGAVGEQATARILQGLSARRWVVLHDLAVPGSRANIDHVVIGRTGVWVIDSKTTRSRVRPGWRRVYFGDRQLDADPVRWEAQVVADRLGAPTRPLIVVHGDLARRARAGRVRVVPAAQLLRSIRRGRRRLSRLEVASAADLAASLPVKGPASDG